MHIVQVNQAFYRGSTGRILRHDDYELHYFLEGDGKWLYSDRKIRVQPYLLALTPINCYHRAEGQNFRFYHMRFLPESAAEETLIDRFRGTLEDGFTIQLSRQYYSTFEKIRRNIRANQEDLRQSASHLFIAFLYEIIGMREAGNMVGATVGRYVPQAMRIIEQNTENQISLDHIAKQLGISKPYLIRLFKQHTGTTPAAYHLQLKIENACYLLEQTHLSIQEIASRLGFYDEFYFSRYFKKQIGVSPSAYRHGTHS